MMGGLGSQAAALGHTATQGHTATRDHTTAQGHTATRDHTTAQGHTATRDHTTARDHTAAGEQSATRGQAAARGRAAAGGRFNVSASTWETLWSFVHRVLVVNLGLTVGGLPLIAGLALVARPWDYPVFFAALACCLGPALAATFGYLAAADNDERAGVAALARTWRRHLRPAAARWTVTTALLGILITDIVMLHDSPMGALLVPMLAILALLVLSAGLTALALLSLRPPRGLWRDLTTAAVVAARRWPLTLLSLVVLGAAAIVVNQAPLLGLATVPGCALALTWANIRIAAGDPAETPATRPVAIAR